MQAKTPTKQLKNLSPEEFNSLAKVIEILVAVDRRLHTNKLKGKNVDSNSNRIKRKRST